MTNNTDRFRMPVTPRWSVFILLLWVLCGCQTGQQFTQPAKADVVRWGRQAPAEIYRKLFPNDSVNHPTPPMRLQIPVLHVDAKVESVGQTKNGAMQTPNLPHEAAWYNLSAIPGGLGNAVIAGHLNQRGNKPDIFWDLKKLQAGDEVFVVDQADVTWKFRVERVVAYPYTEAPLEEIFPLQPGRRLNLITCTGEWNKTQHTYNQRLVVYTIWEALTTD